MTEINAEFGRGLDLGAYRNTIWWTDDGSVGYFSSGAIAFSEFYSKRATDPGGGGGGGDGGGGGNGGDGGGGGGGE